jgi:hypothetical protein
MGGHEARVGQKRNAVEILIVKSEEKRAWEI